MTMYFNESCWVSFFLLTDKGMQASLKVERFEPSKRENTMCEHFWWSIDRLCSVEDYESSMIHLDNPKLKHHRNRADKELRSLRIW